MKLLLAVGFLAALAVVQAACTAPATVLEALQCDQERDVNGDVFHDSSNASDPNPSVIVGADNMVIRTSFTKTTYLSKVYLDINPYSVLFYCYNDTAPNFRQPFGPLSYFEVASKAILVGPGHLEACRSIKGCDGFMMNTVFFVRQFPAACTRFELRYTTNYSRDSSDVIPVNASTIEPGFSLAFFKPPAAPQTGQASTGKIRAMAGAPDDAVLIGESEVQVMIFNITADKIAAAHTEDDTTTAESWALYGTLIAVGVVFIVVAAGAVVYHSSRTPGNYPASRDDEEAATTAGRLQERQRLNERKKSGY